MKFSVAFPLLLTLLSLAVTGRAEDAALLTPPPGPAPKINGPTVYGCRPGHPFLYRIPATGQRPMVFNVKPMPATLEDSR